MSYDARLYDLMTPVSFRGDVEGYRVAAERSGGPVLELGAGTGRITLDIARAGIAVHALDAHPGMLEALRRKLAADTREVHDRVTVIEGDMRRFDLGERFPLIIAPFRVFLHNTTTEDQLACLRSVRTHLRPDGRFVFNVFHPSLAYMAQNSGPLAGIWRWTNTVQQPEGGVVVRSEANRYDTVRQLVYSQHRYDEYGADGTLIRSTLQQLELAYLYAGDLRWLLSEAGFGTVDIAGGFDGQPVERDGDELVVVAKP